MVETTERLSKASWWLDNRHLGAEALRRVINKELKPISVFDSIDVLTMKLDAKTGTPCNNQRGWVGTKPGCRRAKPGTAARVRRIERKRRGKNPEPPKARTITAAEKAERRGQLSLFPDDKPQPVRSQKNAAKRMGQGGTTLKIKDTGRDGFDAEKLTGERKKVWEALAAGRYSTEQVRRSSILSEFSDLADEFDKQIAIGNDPNPSQKSPARIKVPKPLSSLEGKVRRGMRVTVPDSGLQQPGSVSQSTAFKDYTVVGQSRDGKVLRLRPATLNDEQQKRVAKEGKKGLYDIKLENTQVYPQMDQQAKDDYNSALVNSNRRNENSNLAQSNRKNLTNKFNQKIKAVRAIEDPDERARQARELAMEAEKLESRWGRDQGLSSIRKKAANLSREMFKRTKAPQPKRAKMPVRLSKKQGESTLFRGPDGSYFSIDSREWDEAVEAISKIDSKGTLISTLPRRNGKVKYRGQWWTIDKDIAATQKGKKRQVLAKKGDRVMLIAFGDDSYRHNYSPEAKANYLNRSAGIRDKDGNLTKDDPWSPNYWSRKVLWPKGDAVA